ncbi:MAG: DNA-processing protein DprA [Planctomycetota bacterium]
MAAVITAIGRIHLQWALADGVGPLTFSRILEVFGDAEKALHAPPSVLKSIKGIGEQRVEAIIRARDDALVEQEIEAAAASGVRIICGADPDYPPGLRQIPDAPIVLFVKGELRETDAVALAVVGTRRCTIYGSEQARRFGELLAGAGFTVVSGLARGIDAFAHHGAVDAGGRSIAVMGRGLTEIYPPQNRPLADKLLESGAWISELPMRAAVRATNFPGRNRIIAGMTLGTLVVEAGQRSGALITARLASEYNREVFAVPGRAQDPMSFGTNGLIRDGAAKLVTCLEDILDGLGEVGRRMGGGSAAREHGVARDLAAARQAAGYALDEEDEEEGVAVAHGPDPAGAQAIDMQGLFMSGQNPASPAQLSTAEQRVYGVIGDDPVLQDVVMRAAELPPGEVLAAITALELKGLIRRYPGNLVARRRMLA